MTLKTRFSHRCIIVVALTVVFGLGSSVWAASDPASLLPADTFLVVRVQNVNAIKEKFKKTNYHGLYKEPAMQQFIQPAEKKIRELIDEKLKEAWKELGLENPPEKLPIPEGQVVFAMRLRIKTIKHKFPISFDDSGNPTRFRTHEFKTPHPQVIAFAEMGENIETAKTIIAKAVEKAVDEGHKRAEETIRGVKVITISKPRKGDDDVPASDDEPIIYAIKDKTIIVTSSMDLMKHLLVRMSGDEAANLADDPGYRQITKKLGPADVTFFLSGKAIVKLIKDTTDGEAEKADKTIRALGLDKFVGLGATLSIAPKPTEDMRLKLFAGTRGEKTGLLALLSPKPMSTKPTRLLTKGLAAFFVANYDLGEVFDQIAGIVSAIKEDMDLTKQIQQVMAATGEPGEGGRPSVDLRKDVLGQMSGPVVVTNWIDKPFTAADSSKILLIIGVRDRGVLNAALGRIHDVFLAGGNKELRRELRNITMYLMPGSPLAMMMPFPQRGGQKTTAFAVPGNHFVFGSLGVVEQFIRNLERKDVQSIAADPMYRYASRYLPAQAGMFFYGNGQASTEAVWAQVKDAAGKKPAAGEGDQPEGRYMEMGASGNPMFMMVKMLEKYCDFTTLPDFSVVKKYFGPSVGYVIGTEDGIYGEVISLKAPPAKP